MNLMFFVYGLFDSRDWSECRYVGAASYLYRPLEHEFEAIRGQRGYKTNWIRKVLSSGGYVGWKILAACETREELYATERWLILCYRISGHRLTNRTEGGEGVRLTMELIEKRKLTCSLPEVKARQRASLREAALRPDVRARRSLAQRAAQNRPEVREKHRVAQYRNQSDPNFRARMLQFARRNSALRSQSAKAAWIRRRQERVAI